MMPSLLYLLFISVNILLISVWKVHSNENVCETPQCLKTAEMIRANRDTSMSPCHDFYQYACGNYKEHNPIPATRRNWSPTNLRNNDIKKETLEFLKGNQENNNPIIKKVREAFNACLDTEKIEKLGDTAIPINLAAVGLPMKPPFNTDVKEPFNLARVLAKMRRYIDTSFLFDTEVKCDFKEKETNRFTIGLTPSATNQAKSSLYFDTVENNVEEDEELTKDRDVREGLQDLMSTVVHYMYQLTYSQFSKSTPQIISKRIDQVIDFFIQLQKTKKLEAKGRVAKQNKSKYSTLPELQKITDEILDGAEIKFNWFDYVETLFDGIETNIKEKFEKGEVITIMDMDQLTETLKILSKVDKKIIFSSLWWISAQSALFGSTKTIRQKNQEYYEKISKLQKVERQETCFNFVKSTYPFIIGYQLTKLENSFNQRDKAVEMVTNISNSLTDSIENSDWLDDSTKMAALSKLGYMYSNMIVSFPDWVMNSNNLDSLYKENPVEKNSFFLTYMFEDKKNFERQLGWIHKKNEFGGMGMSTPADVNAYYSPWYNGAEIPIGILGFPYFNLGLDALDYGAIGTVIGHELVHGFDNSGKNYDSWGAASKWWEPEILAKYEEREKCFVECYGQYYYDVAEKKVDGQLTLPENIADNGGFNQALKAYREHVQKQGVEPMLKGLENFSHEQLFTLAFANSWCENAGKEFGKWLIENDEHAPAPARVNMVAKNSPDFARIWGCSPSSKLNKDLKCKLW